MITNTKSPATHSIYRANLKKQIADSQQQIRENINDENAKIVPRTQAINAKRPYQTFEEEQRIRSDLIAEQIKLWRCTLPTLIKKLSRIPDPRRPRVVTKKVSSPLF